MNSYFSSEFHVSNKGQFCYYLPFSALDTDPGDVKARFRRAQAYQKLGRLDQAFLDTQRCAQLEPKNRAFQDLLRLLGAQIHQKVT